MLTADRVIELLGLERLPYEGGFFRETYRAGGAIPPGVIPEFATDRPRAHSTQIYYLLRTGETSSLHRVRSDEVFHHYLGDPVVQLRINDFTRTHEPSAARGGPVAEIVRIGRDLEGGERPQVVAPADVWQGAELGRGPHGFALLGCSVAPGFDWEDFELIGGPRAAALAALLPEHASLIGRLTPAEGRTRA